MKAELIDHMGSDLTVVNAARVSFDKESEWEYEEIVFDKNDNSVPTGKGVLNEKDKKLISYLAKYNHFTPFTHCVVTLRETVPIFVARQRFKHTVGFSYNEVSRRYVDDTPVFFVPDTWRRRAENKKQGSSDEEVTQISYDYDVTDYCSPQAYYADFIKQANAIYEDFIAAGVAPEQARMVLPQSMYTSYYVTGSLSAWTRAFNLRSDPHAQKEIQDLAAQWKEIIQPLFPVSWTELCGS
jgi:thymidylate synthase (FAD)